MADIQHEDIPLGERHAPHNWEYADEAARLAAVITDTKYVGRQALQLDDGSYWRLASAGPAVWVGVAAQGPAGADGTDGTDGVDGTNGAAGLSAYEVAVSEGFVGDEAAWLASLQGEPGTDGVDGSSFTINAQGLLAGRSAYDSESENFSYLATDTGDLYIRQTAVAGTWSDPIPFGKGDKGDTGDAGADGADGADGKSAYEVAVFNGFVGDEAAWLLSLKGATGDAGSDGTNGTDGADGLSAYQIAVNEGFVGDEAAWLLSLKGADGDAGTNGTNGSDGIDGADGLSAYQIAVNEGFGGDEAAWLASLQGADGADGADGAAGTSTITHLPVIVATEGQTEFPIDGGAAGIQLWLYDNGRKLSPNGDYTIAPDGLSFTLTVAAAAGEELEPVIISGISLVDNTAASISIADVGGHFTATTVEGALAELANATGGGMTDADRQNGLLNWIYQSKLFAGYRRGIKLFADGFKAADGINAGASSGYTVDTANGKVGPVITAGAMIARTTGTNTGNMTANGGLAGAFDGATSQASGTSAVGLTTTASYVGKAYSPGQPIGYATVYPSTDVNWIDGGTATTVTLNLRANHTAPASSSDGTLLGSTGGFTDAPGSKTIASNDRVTEWEYVWIEIQANSTTNTVIAEIAFYLPDTASSIVLGCVAQTIPASTKARALIEYNPVDATTLNTDLTVELSCNGGTNYVLATLTAAGTGQAGRLVAETNEVTCTAGTSLVVRTKTLNNKNVQLFGIAATAN